MNRSALATARPDARAKRRALRAWLSSGRLMRMPGAFSPLVAMAVERAGFEGVYVSGAALAADLGLPDVGLTTLTEVAGRGAQIARATALPTLIDADTGFGGPMNVARTVQALEDAGLAGCHLEDQENPKRCGHLDHKTLVDEQTMTRRIRAAVDARRDPDFVICARSDARASEGLEATVRRLRRYVDAGADMVFPEALAGAHEFAAVRAAVDAPLLANMTEFGKSELLEVAALEAAGVSVVIYPVTTLRLAMGAVERGLEAIAADGTQAALVGQMQTRSRLYELLGYAEYAAFDADVFNFTLTGSGR
ncbi:MAG: methylisocitrate lyase [Miltoncostaeaceae bacterium]|jgi:methylisocitrate lyase|nr:methylisocitrate lyase [Miltoncostaeaceae bacterium]